MKSSARMVLVAVVIVVILLLLWWLWGKRGPETTQPVTAPPPIAEIAPKPTIPSVGPALFDYDRAEVRPEEARILDGVIAATKDLTIERIEVTGHADRIGSEKYNQGLSMRRAEAVREYLIGKGLDGSRIRIDARGESEPTSGEACKDMKPEHPGNRKLVDCLQKDRRTQLIMIAAP